MLQSPAAFHAISIALHCLLLDLCSHPTLTLMLDAGTHPSDNFWGDVRKNHQRKRLEAIQSGDKQQLEQVTRDYMNLMRQGFLRRVVAEASDVDLLDPNAPAPDPRIGLVRRAVTATSNRFELRSSKSDQLTELHKKRLAKRSWAFRLLPSLFQRLVDFTLSIRVQPSRQDMFTSLAAGTIFAFISYSNQRLKGALKFAVLGQATLFSMLLTRGTRAPAGSAQRPGPSPAPKGLPFALHTIQLALFYSLSTALATTAGARAVLELLSRVFFSAVKLTVETKWQTSLAISVLLSSFLLAYLQVQEDRNAVGEKWRRAMSGLPSSQASAHWSSQLQAQERLAVTEMYDYPYDPDQDDDKMIVGEGQAADKPSSSMGNADDPEAEHRLKYEQWKKERDEQQRQRTTSITLDEKQIGVRKGLLESKAPKWLKDVFLQSEVTKTPWKRAVKPVEKKTEQKFSVEGPMGFRDKTPAWLEPFDGFIWEETTVVNRRAARAYGAYRKCMWKLDPEVRLLPCDGADKEKEGEKRDSKPTRTPPPPSPPSSTRK